jgi:hypothetical protein
LEPTLSPGPSSKSPPITRSSSRRCKNTPATSPQSLVVRYPADRYREQPLSKPMKARDAFPSSAKVFDKLRTSLMTLDARLFEGDFRPWKLIFQYRGQTMTMKHRSTVSARKTFRGLSRWEKLGGRLTNLLKESFPVLSKPHAPAWNLSFCISRKEVWSEESPHPTSPTMAPGERDLWERLLQDPLTVTLQDVCKVSQR